MSGGSSRDERFDEIVADYLDAIEAGEAPDESAMLAENPDLAGSLRRFFLDHQRMNGLFEEPSDGSQVEPPPAQTRPGSVTQTPADQPTLGYDEVSSEVLGAERIGDYLLLGKIAEGGMGVVYRARQVSLNRTVALKMIRAGELADAEEVQRFRVEAEAAAQLNHPGIVPIYQIGSAGGQHYFSMALVEGSSLADLIRQDAVPPKQAAAYVIKVARATQYAHQRGIIHRDIKPANVLINSDGEPMITDFGLAKRIKADHELTMSGQILGTASYMPPEQASGNADQITPQSDVYALGALLYALLTQQPPFPGSNPLDVLLDVLSKDPAPPSSLNSQLSRDLETICMKCLEKQPAKRYASAEALADDLQRYLEGKPIVARPISKDERLVRWIRRKPAYATAIALAVVLTVGAPLAYVAYRSASSVATRTLFQAKSLPGQSVSTAGPSLVKTARSFYRANPLGPFASLEDEAYAAAAQAMLYFDRADDSSPARPYFQSAATKLDAELRRDFRNAALRSALADCHLQLARYLLPAKTTQTPSSLDREQSLQHLERSQHLLEGLVDRHPDNPLLRERLARLVADRSVLAESLTDRKKILDQAADISKKWDGTIGLIRFEITSSSPPTSIHADALDSLRSRAEASFDPDVQFEFAHAARALNFHEEAINAYRDAFSMLRRVGRKLDSDELRRCFVDLTLLDEVSPEGVKLLPSSIWPSEPKAFYIAVLAIRSTEMIPGPSSGASP